MHSHSGSEPTMYKADQRLVNQAFTSFLAILVLGLVIAGLFIVTPPPTQILGLQTSTTGGK